jgi:hypothetical protein
LELDDSVHAALRSVVARCNAARKSSGGANTHGALSVKKLLTLIGGRCRDDAESTGCVGGFDDAGGAQRARLSVLQ